MHPQLFLTKRNWSYCDQNSSNGGGDLNKIDEKAMERMERIEDVYYHICDSTTEKKGKLSQEWEISIDLPRIPCFGKINLMSLPQIVVYGIGITDHSYYPPPAESGHT